MGTCNIFPGGTPPVGVGIYRSTYPEETRRRRFPTPKNRRGRRPLCQRDLQTEKHANACFWFGSPTLRACGRINRRCLDIAYLFIMPAIPDALKRGPDV